MKNKILRHLVIGIVVWLVPFVTSFGLFDRTGKPNVNTDLIKSIVVVISSFAGTYAGVKYFKAAYQQFMRIHCFKILARV